MRYPTGSGALEFTPFPRLQHMGIGQGSQGAIPFVPVRNREGCEGYGRSPSIVKSRAICMAYSRVSTG